MKFFNSMKKQLFWIYLVIIVLLVISLGFILPNTLMPIYEENLYNRLKSSLLYVSNINEYVTEDSSLMDINIGYIYIQDDNILGSSNLNDIIKFDDINKIINKIEGRYGSFVYKAKKYYYYARYDKYGTRISLTNNQYITQLKSNIIRVILTIVGLTLIIIFVIIILWSNYWSNRIRKLKEKVKNIDNDDYISESSDIEDELHSLDVAIDDMKIYLKEQEEYKNQMYQNISHDFKTPIAVIKSYIEASEDGVETYDKVLSVIKEQISKLEYKVHSLLYLNKLNYIKDKKNLLQDKHDVSLTIMTAVDKFKIMNADIEFIVDIDKKNSVFRGSSDMWEAIIENILNNFMRYAKTKIEITVKNNKIILFNDGPAIDKKVLNNIFTPYEKGVNGVFGLGLSIVKKTLQYLNYDIDISNVKNGVKFIIK